MKENLINYRRNPDKSITFFDIPDGEGRVDVTIRPLTRRDRAAVNALTDDPNQEEKLLSLMVTQWGDQQGITSLELLHESKDEAVAILGQAFQEFFRTEYSFRERK